MYGGKLLCKKLEYNFNSCNDNVSLIVKRFNFLNNGAVWSLYLLNVIIRIALF